MCSLRQLLNIYSMCMVSDWSEQQTGNKKEAESSNGSTNTRERRYASQFFHMAHYSVCVVAFDVMPRKEVIHYISPLE